MLSSKIPKNGFGLWYSCCDVLLGLVCHAAQSSCFEVGTDLFYLALCLYLFYFTLIVTEMMSVIIYDQS